MSYNDTLNKSIDDICDWLFSDVKTNASLYVSYLKSIHGSAKSFNMFSRNSIVYTYSTNVLDDKPSRVPLDKNSREYLSYSTVSEDNIDTIEIVKIGYSRPEYSNLSHFTDNSGIILFISKILYLDGTIKNVYVYEAKFKGNFIHSNDSLVNVVCNWNSLNLYLRDYKLNNLLTHA